VYINNIAVGSAALDPANSNGGTLTVRVPTSELGKNRWVLDIACYHELGAVDCAKLFGDVAWTVIDGDSTVTFGPGRMPAWPTVAGFPYLVPTGEGRIGVTMWLPKTPTDQQLTTAAMIAARAAQVNPLPIEWTVVMGDTLEGDARKQSIIIIGSGGDTGRFADMGKLPVCPSTSGAYVIKNTLNLLPAAMRDAAIIQAGPSPWRKDRIVYAVLADSDEALARLCATLAMPTIGSRLDGDVCLVTSEGKDIMLDSVTKEERERSVTAEADRYNWPMVLVMGVIALGVFSFFAWVARQFRRRPSPLRPAVPPTTSGEHHVIS
jgi:hypothetical protein